VPLEGHWDRVNTPLRETTLRERRLARVVGAFVAVAVVAGVIAAIATSGPGTKPGCVNVDVPSTMGGGGIHACGQRAAEFCRGPVAHSAPLAASALPKCREAGYSVAPQ
jgi:hypothetical protein